MADLVDRDGPAFVGREATINIPPLEARETCTNPFKTGNLRERTAGLAGFEEDSHVEVEGVVYVRGDTFVAANEVKVGQKIEVYNLSGCSAIFVFCTGVAPPVATVAKPFRRLYNYRVRYQSEVTVV